MGTYLLRRLLLMVPTLLGIMLINFAIVQFAPGGPVEQMVYRIEGHGGVSATSRFSGPGAEIQNTTKGEYRASQGLPPEFIEEIKKQYGFDKPMHQRFLMMLYDYARFDFGESFFRSVSVADLILEKLPVSISLGLWSTLLIYLISIPLGIKKAVEHSSRFDIWTSSIIIIGYAIPGFLFGILLIVIFSGGSFLDWFPLRGLTSPDFDTLSWPAKIIDYFWHITLPILAYTIGGFATITMLTKNSFLDEINKQYVVTARAKGLHSRQVLYGHVFRNAMLIVIAGFPSAFVSIFFAGSLLIEVIFSLDGMGRLGYEAVINRDYPVVFATLFIFTLITLVFKLISDIVYRLVDPRIDFESRG